MKDLCHLQYGLDAKLYTDKFIYNKFINACQDIPACQYACFKLADSLAGLINDLRSSIITFQKASPDNMQTQAFFTNWRYHKQYQTPLSAHAQKDYGDSWRNNQAWVGKKKCLVCNKEGCWSSRHTREECEDSKKLKSGSFEGLINEQVNVKRSSENLINE